MSCASCGAICEVRGRAWRAISPALDLALFLALGWALAVAIGQPLYGASVAAAALFAWLGLLLAALRLGHLSVGVRPGPVTADAAPKPALAGLLAHGWLSGIGRGAWCVAVFGYLVAAGIGNIPLMAACAVYLVLAGAALRRVSPILEKMHRCPACGGFAISSWEKLSSPLLRHPRCGHCGAANTVSAGVMGWGVLVFSALLHAAPIAALVYGSFIPFVILGVCVAASTVFVINFVPILERHGKG